ncbi:conjugal transfer protein [Streptomyces cadmiisoli]|uniref:Conjugal transfer protein n=1 Tax=Streptomyces cadmiisoli TaxID=2184053 RepID=A0A2Z4JAB3_9ACTN|nr:conjugal transfer protein [Streptomyces cadmiisoli]AWW41867.1 conjugal transfer protein [Streptomyces cadmiisoli]
MSPGKQVSQSEAVTIAGARLKGMRRRVRLSRLALLTAIAAGPLALGVSVWPGPATVAAAPSTKPATVRTAAVAADPAGYAQVFVSAWLRSSVDDTTTAQARLAQSMAPDVELPDLAAGAQGAPESVTAVRSAQHGAGVWSVTLAAQYPGGSVRYYAVPVVVDGAGASFAVAGQPGVVAGPGRATTPKSPYAVTVPPGSALSSTVEEFLAAYLAGAGEVDRYLAPGVKPSLVSPVPYSGVTVRQVSAVDESAAGRVPADGTRVRVRAEVEAADASGRWPLAYELSLAARAGRWEITATRARIDGARDGGARP